MRHVLLLRGINLGPTRRVPMADLRNLLGEAGCENVRTYVQSGNIVLDAPATPAALETEAQRLISERFGFDVPVIARSRDELSAVVALNPLKDVATNPKRYQVSFLSAELPADVVTTLQAAATGDERLVAHGRELYAWHPEGVARSKMWNTLAGKRVGATARNWTTVTTLLAMADE
jgi:uncharacterized protein (DUF1697 family)